MIFILTVAVAILVGVAARQYSEACVMNRRVVFLEEVMLAVLLEGTSLEAVRKRIAEEGSDESKGLFQTIDSTFNKYKAAS